MGKLKRKILQSKKINLRRQLQVATGYRWQGFKEKGVKGDGHPKVLWKYKWGRK
jgi:hypothetical protein